MNVEILVNGKKVKADISPALLLSEFLRETLDLTGTHVGCDTSQCGACVVHVDGLSMKSCTLLAVTVDGKSVTTIEGLAKTAGADLHPMQEAFHLNHGLQCGFCTPGMLLTAQELLAAGGVPRREQIREHISGNYCRCTGYHAIVDAVEAVAQARHGMKS